MVSWPSAGSGVSKRTYADDRGRARMSGPALGRAILKATDYIRNTPRSERCDGRIHLLCHSMGNWALRGAVRSEEHTSELQSLMRISYAVFCLKKKTSTIIITQQTTLTTH